MRAGSLDRLITIQSKGVTRSASGQENVTWSDVATVSARKRDTKGEERFRAGQREDRVETIFTIRWRGDLDPSMRVRLGTVFYELKGIVELGRRDGLELLTSRQISATAAA